MEVPKTVDPGFRTTALPKCQQARLLDTIDENVGIYGTCRLPLGVTDCIRLLEICSIDSQHISCQLSVASIHEPYIALSYIWGDPTVTHEILVNRRPFRVGGNLLDFLHQARTDQADKEVVPRFWIDALCINQADVPERNHQVGIMGQIYANASWVLVWLGADQVPVQRALAHSNASMQHSQSAQRLRRDDLERLVHHPYWSRAWTRQEFIMASKIDVQCGPLHVDVAVLDRHKSDYLEPLQKGTQITRGQDRKPFMFDVMEARRGWHRRGSQFHVVPWTGCWLLSSCSEARDKIYALAALMHPNHRITPDYEITVKQLFLDIADRHLPWDEYGTHFTKRRDLAQHLGLLPQDFERDHLRQLGLKESAVDSAQFEADYTRRTNIEVRTPYPELENTGRKCAGFAVKALCFLLCIFLWLVLNGVLYLLIKSVVLFFSKRLLPMVVQDLLARIPDPVVATSPHLMYCIYRIFWSRNM